MTKPRSLTVNANGLDHHVLEWSPTVTKLTKRADAAPGPPPVAVLIHGYMDAAGTWDLVAPALAHAGMRVLAPDMRGFGNGPRAPEGSYYHFAEYIADLADIVDALADDAPFRLVGHSMGGSIATYFTGAFPGRVSKLALLEGLGPPDNPFDVAPDRMRRWIDDQRAARPKRATPRAVSMTDAYRRLVLNHPSVDAAILKGRLPHLVREGDDGLVTWRFDPMHKTVAPQPFFVKYFMAFAERVACPVLLVGGGPQGFHPPDEAERVAAFQRVEHAELEGAGHMMHWTRPTEVAQLLVRFLEA